MSGYIHLLFRAGIALQRRPTCVSGLYRRTMRTMAMHPHEVLLQPLPPLTSTDVGASTVDSSSPISIDVDHRPYRPLYVSDHQKTLQRAVVKLSRDLRRCYPKLIQWAAEEPSPYVSYHKFLDRRFILLVACRITTTTSSCRPSCSFFLNSVHLS